MTKSHPMHRKKSIHMHFRRAQRERRLFYRMLDKIEQVCSRSKVVVKDNTGER